jgi:anti-anti-sigma factor
MPVIGGSAELVLHGALDRRSVTEVRGALGAFLDRTTGDVVIDVAAVNLVDVTGLGVLASAHRRAEREGRRLVLRGCTGSLRRVLRLTRLVRVMHLEEPEKLPA